MSEDQREALYALTRAPNGKLQVGRPYSEEIATIVRQLDYLRAYNMAPVGISLSMDVLMQHDIACRVAANDGVQRLFNLPVTIIGDKSGVIAWSFAL